MAPSYYNKHTPPKPYLARAYDLNMTNPDCLWDYNTDTVVVDMQLPIKQVVEIYLIDHGGSIEFEGTFSIAWADPELTSCICSPWEVSDKSGMWWERLDDYIASVVMGGGLEAPFLLPYKSVKTLYMLSVNRPFLLPYFCDKKEYWTCSCLRMLSSFTLVNLNVHILNEF